MPPYPFSQRPLFLDFKQRLLEFGCEYKTLEAQLDIDFYTVPYFERVMTDRVLRCVVVFEDYDRLEFSDIRRICRILEIPGAEFGLDLTDWYE